MVIGLLLQVLVVYLAAMTILGFAAMGIDKRKAIRQKRRIPEKTLLIIAIAGGSLGALLGMLLFRHKTKHPKFFIGIPLILAFQAVLIYYIIIAIK